MFDILSVILKYVFIVLIYLFIFTIIRMIYLDIKSMKSITIGSEAYVKVLNPIGSLNYRLKDIYPINERLIIGRRKDNDIVSKDPFVSKYHCQITQEENNYFLEDLDSSNGTLLNNEPLEDVVKLKTGDIITIGGLELIFLDRR